MNERIARTEKDSEVFWKILEPHMAAIIHSPNHRERDELVDKLVAGTLVECEMKRTAELLEENIRENKDEGKRLASALLLARVKGLIEKTELDKKAKIIEEERKRSEAEETWRKNTRDKQLSRHH
jgi:hypothetical protein